jgi:hypothetical protein
MELSFQLRLIWLVETAVAIRLLGEVSIARSVVLPEQPIIKLKLSTIRRFNFLFTIYQYLLIKECQNTDSRGFCQSKLWYYF